MCICAKYYNLIFYPHFIIELNTYKSIPQQFSVSYAVDHMHDQTHAVHTTITGHLISEQSLYLYLFFIETGRNL